MCVIHECTARTHTNSRAPKKSSYWPSFPRSHLKCQHQCFFFISLDLRTKCVRVLCVSYFGLLGHGQSIGGVTNRSSFVSEFFYLQIRMVLTVSKTTQSQNWFEKLIDSSVSACLYEDNWSHCINHIVLCIFFNAKIREQVVSNSIEINDRWSFNFLFCFMQRKWNKRRGKRLEWHRMRAKIISNSSLVIHTHTTNHCASRGRRWRHCHVSRLTRIQMASMTIQKEKHRFNAHTHTHTSLFISSFSFVFIFQNKCES